MNVNVKLSINDEERRNFADYLDGHTSQRIATRKDVNNFVRGCLDAALNYEAKITSPFVSEEDEIKQLTIKGFDASYIRGWLQVKNR